MSPLGARIENGRFVVDDLATLEKTFVDVEADHDSDKLGTKGSTFRKLFGRLVSAVRRRQCAVPNHSGSEGAVRCSLARIALCSCAVRGVGDGTWMLRWLWTAERHVPGFSECLPTVWRRRTGQGEQHWW